MMQHKENLLDCAMPVFSMLEQMRQYSHDEPSIAYYGTSLRNLLHQFERTSFEKQIPSHQVHDAKYALAALIDETVLRSNLKDKEQWIAQLIQVEQFGEHLAGENFFHWLDRVKRQGPDYLPVLEVFYVCLKMGFMGKYRVEGQEKLNAIHVDVKHQIDLYLGQVDPRLSPHKDKMRSIQTFKRQFPWWGFCAAASAMMVVLYIGYSVAISTMVRGFIGHL